MKSIKVFGTRFILENFQGIIEELKKGGLMVVPSGPGLATIDKDKRYAKAIQNADFAIPDSAYLVLLIKILKGVKINKLSGYNFLYKFFKEKFNKNDIFLIDPNETDSDLNNAYLNQIAIPIDKSNHYVAPIYGTGDISDLELLNILNTMENKPKYIMINLGSNIQEPLGFYLIMNLNFKPSIICTGAAISYFTGTQAKITPLFDKLGFGWFLRCIKKPTTFIPRYLKAFRLIFLVLKSEVKIN